MQAALNQVKQAMVGAILKAQGAFIFINSDITDLDSCGRSAFGARFLDGQCFGLVIPRGGGRLPCFSDTPESILGMFADGTSGHNIDPADFFANANTCNNAGVAALAGGVNSNFPHCFFNLPIAKAQGDPCKKCFVAADGVSVACPDGFLTATCEQKTDVEHCSIGDPGCHPST